MAGFTYPTIDPELGEHLAPDEEVHAHEIADAIEQVIRSTYPPGSARRDAHPKHHGLQRGELRIHADIPAHLARGVFQPGAVYQAYLRFSNGDGDPTRSDDNQDGRGLAIKLLDVPGEKILASQHDATTQDFVMINHPFFLINDPRKYLELVKKGSSRSAFVQATIPLAIGLKSTLRAKAVSGGKIANPLQVRYFSATPYQFGTGPDRTVMKFSVAPTSDRVDPLRKDPGPDYLRQAMLDTLGKGDVTFRFMIQLRTTDELDVEDVMTEWDEGVAPFVEVATLVIPQQDFATAELDALAEDLSFDPWHALPEHRPLGCINRLRGLIYDRISDVRHELNGTERLEPK